MMILSDRFAPGFLFGLALLAAGAAGSLSAGTSVGETPLTGHLAAQEGDVATQDETAQDDVDPLLRQAVEEIQAEIEEIRGLEFLRPVGLRVASVEDLQVYIKGRLEQMTTPAELDALDTVAKLTGLLPADQSLLGLQMELVESQVGGFYDPQTDTFSLMESLVGGGLAKIILAHELTHALDDQHFDIDGTLKKLEDDADALWAYQAVVEGSATAVMNKWTIQKMMSGDGALTQEELEKASSMGADVLERMQPFLWKPMLGAYLRGSAFLARTDSVLKGSMTMPPAEDLNRAFKTPPLSSEQVLHPSAYWEEDCVDAPVEVSLATASLPDGVTVLLEGKLGELQLGFIVEPPDERKGVTGQLGLLGAKYSSDAVDGWGGDRFALLAIGDARAFVLRTQWDTEEDAREFSAALNDEVIRDHLSAALLAFAKERGLPEQSAFSSALGRNNDVSLVLAAGIDSAQASELKQLLFASN